MLITATITLNYRYEPSVRHSLQQEVLHDIVVPDKVLFLHKIAAVGLIGLVTPMQLLLADTEVSMVGEIKAGALAIVSVKKLLKVFHLYDKTWICLQVHISLKGSELDLEHLENVDTLSKTSCWLTSTVRYSDKEVEAAHVDYTKHTIAIEEFLSDRFEIICSRLLAIDIAQVVFLDYKQGIATWKLLIACTVALISF